MSPTLESTRAASVARRSLEVSAGLVFLCASSSWADPNIPPNGRFVSPTEVVSDAIPHLDVTLGDATVDSRYVIFSCTKALIASAIWLLIGDDRLDPSERVAEIVPEFATNGKDVVTVEQLLLHTSGFPRAPLGPPDWYTREGRLARAGPG